MKGNGWKSWPMKMSCGIGLRKGFEFSQVVRRFSRLLMLLSANITNPMVFYRYLKRMVPHRVFILASNLPGETPEA
jgi:hypothetical protein